MYSWYCTFYRVGKMCNISHPLYQQNSFTALKTFVLQLFVSSLTTTLWQSRFFFFLTISMCASMLICFSYVQYSVMLWTMACQAPLSMGFSRQNTGVGSHVPQTISIVLPFLEYHIVGVLHCASLSDWLLSPRNMYLRSLCIFLWLDNISS